MNNSYRTFLTISLFLFIITISFGQKITILDIETRMPIGHVMVFDESESDILVSDANGQIDLSNFNKSLTLWLKHPGYELKILPPEKRKANVFLTPKMFTIDEFVVSANRAEESKKDIPYFVQTITPHTIEYKNASNSADILSSTGFVAIQKSQGGGGSPILRGFEANRVLLVIDGVRMNNAIYRSGHLQNSITIDPAILNSTEVLFGPSSVIYGSDALGGVVSYMTQNPVLASGNKPEVSSEATLQYQSASKTKKLNYNMNAGFKKWASLTSISLSNYGDITMGKYRPKNTQPENWGKMIHYSKKVNGEDQMLENPNPNKQLFSGYKQYDLLQKFNLKLNTNHTLTLNTQYSTSSDISRFDQLNDYKGDLLKFSEYYYGPQKRLLTSAKSHYTKDCNFFTSLQTIIAYQNIEESRYSRKFGKDETLSQIEKLNIWSLNFDLVKSFSKDKRINYGFEFLYNELESTADYININTKETSNAPTRYPNGGTFTHTYAIYLNYHQNLNEKIALNTGIRLGFYHYSSAFNPDAFFTPPINQLNNKSKAPSGSFGLVYHPNKSWKINGVFTSGYRVPNVDDYGKIRAKNGEISLPNTMLKPEYAYNFELSSTKTFFEEQLAINITYFKTWLQDAIVRSFDTPFSFDSIDYDGDKYRIFTNTNAQRATIQGISAGINFQPLKILSLHGTINYTTGEIIDTKEPMGHIPPVFGRIGATYRNNKYRSEIYFIYQAWKKLEDMSPYGEDNEAEGTETGFPSWRTLNWANQYQINSKLQLQISVENIFDLHYKTFASGINSPGRSLIVSLTSRF